MEPLINLNDLLAQQVKTIYDAEQYLSEALPRIERKAVSRELQAVLLRQEDEKRRQLSRLGEVFRHLHMKPEAETNEGIRCLSAQKKSMLERCKNGKMVDASITIYDRAMTTLQVNAYQSAVACAVELDHREAARLLRRCLREEKGIERQLGHFEEELIEDLAMVPVSA